MPLSPEPASPFVNLRERLAAVDPGGFAARTALRASLALAASALLLLAFGRPYGDPVLLAIVGGEVAMMTSASVADPSLGAQRITLLLCVIASAAAIILATLVAPVPWLAIVVLCVLVFVVVYMRRFGPRGSAVGLLAFMGYFLALYVGAKASQLRGMLGAILTGGVVAYVVHFWIVREHAERVRQAVLRSFAARVLLLLDQVAIDAESAGRSSRRARRIRRATGRVGEVALALELAVGRTEEKDPPPHVREWISSLLHAEVAVDMLVEAVQRVGRSAPGDDRRLALARMVRALRPWITEGDVASRDEALRIYGDARARRDQRGDTDQPEVWWRLDRALETITASRPWSAFPPLDGDVEAAVPVTAFNPGGGGAAGVPGPSPDLRLAIQATIAVALSVWAGRAISGDRWYWAVFAAFVVFVRATTVGETFSRAWQRMLGTVVGVAIGLGVAVIVGHRAWPAAMVGLVAIFLAYYLMRISYTGMMACFTIVLALLYEEMGRAPAGLMALRLAETFAGAGDRRARLGARAPGAQRGARSRTRRRRPPCGDTGDRARDDARSSCRERRAAARRDPQRRSRTGGSARGTAPAVGTERAGRADRRDEAGTHLGGAGLRDAPAVGGVALGRRRARRAAARDRRADDGQLPRRRGRAGAGKDRARRAGGRDARPPPENVRCRRRKRRSRGERRGGPPDGVAAGGHGRDRAGAGGGRD